jgi:mRNA-degrading endonuclease toxin of MazEF toxin-antitoxin module
MENEKDFNTWNEVKKKINSLNRTHTFFEKEIWWCNVGINVGSEQNGKGSESIRPVYILRKINRKTFVGIPLSSILREDNTHVSFYFHYDMSVALISQIRNFDKKRLQQFIGLTSDYLHMKIRKATVAFILG